MNLIVRLEIIFAFHSSNIFAHDFTIISSCGAHLTFHPLLHVVQKNLLRTKQLNRDISKSGDKNKLESTIKVTQELEKASEVH